MDPARSALNRLPRWFLAIVAAPPTIFLLLFYVWPFSTLVARGLGVGAVSDTFGASRTWSVLWFTSWQAVLSTALTLVFALPSTWAVARFAFLGRRLLISVLSAVFVLPTVVVGAAFVAVLPASLDRSIWAILGAHVAFNLAVVVRTVAPAWEQLPVDMERAAATLGAGPWQVFRTVTLPLLRPAFASAAAIVFLFTFTSFGVIRVLGSIGQSTIEVEVWRQATQLGNVGVAAVLSLIQLAALALMILWSTSAQRRHARVVALDVRSRRTSPRGRARVAVGASVGMTAGLVLAPLVALVERSLRSDGRYSLRAWRTLGDNEIRPGLRIGIDPIDSLANSATTAIWATLFAVVIGSAAVVAITASGRAGRVLDAGLMLPLGTSAVTIGFGMLITFDTAPFDWRASWWLVPVGQALVAVPFVVRSALAVLRSVDPDLRAAAATLGAPPITAWRLTTLPFLWRPLTAGAGLAAAISLGEFGATSFLSRTGGETVPIAIERLLGRTGSVFQAQAFVLATILAAATIVIVIAVDAGGDRARRS